MLPPQGGEVLEEVGRDGSPLAFEMPHCGFKIGGVPQDDSTGDEVERAGSMALGLQSMITDTACAMEEDSAFEVVLGLSLVQFAGGAASLLGEFDPVEREQCTLDTAYLSQGKGETVGARIGAKPLQHQRRAGDAGADRYGEPDYVVPVVGDQAFVDRLSSQRGDRWPRPHVGEQMQAPVPDVGDTWGETKTKEMTQGKHMVGNAPSIGVMALDREVCAMMEQTIENMRGLACPGGDDRGMERRVAIRDMGIEGNGGFAALVWIDRSGRLRPTIEREMLPVRAGRGAVAE